jgi:hypothetical protein
VATNLCAGVYSYTITDLLGCQISQTYTLTQPPLTSLSLSETDVTCNGACNGSATVTPSGGVPPFTYTWTPGSPIGQGTSSISNLCPGTYSVNTKDANGCSNNGSIAITEPLPITPNVSSVIRPVTASATDLSALRLPVAQGLIRLPCKARVALLPALLRSQAYVRALTL